MIPQDPGSERAVYALIAARNFIFEMQIRAALHCTFGDLPKADWIVEHCRIVSVRDGRQLLFVDDRKLISLASLEDAPLDKPIK